jgi:hypothetical protein
MGWLEWIGVGAGVLVLLAIIGYFIEKKEKAEKKAAAVRCPKCGADNAIKRLYDEDTRGPYVFMALSMKTGVEWRVGK